MTASLRGVVQTLTVTMLAFLPAQAAAGQADSFEDLAKVVRPGDMVEVTEWTRTRTKGNLAELTASSIAVVKDGRWFRIDAGDVKEIRLLRRRGAGPTRAADAGARCADAPCMAMSLAFAGTTAVGRGVGRLFARPKIVYRAVPACTLSYASFSASVG